MARKLADLARETDRIDGDCDSSRAPKNPGTSNKRLLETISGRRYGIAERRDRSASARRNEAENGGESEQRKTQSGEKIERERKEGNRGNRDREIERQEQRVRGG